LESYTFFDILIDTNELESEKGTLPKMDISKLKAYRKVLIGSHEICKHTI
jgi:hypothetical protein